MCALVSVPFLCLCVLKRDNQSVCQSIVFMRALAWVFVCLCAHMCFPPQSSNDTSSTNKCSGNTKKKQSSLQCTDLNVKISFVCCFDVNVRIRHYEQGVRCPDQHTMTLSPWRRPPKGDP